MTNPNSYWPGEPVGSFLADAVTRPATAELRAIAERYIVQVAPGLPPLAARVLANSAADRLLAQAPADADTLPDSLMPFERWEWQELTQRVPFDVEGGRSMLERKIWGADNWHHRHEADELQRQLGVTLSDWFYWTPMTQVTAWRKAFLPEVQGRRRKLELLNLLAGLKPFPAPIVEAYRAWQAELRSQFDVARAKADAPPVPQHLAWLAGLVERRLLSHYHVTHSVAGPAGHARLAQALAALQANQIGARQADLTAWAERACSRAHVGDVFEQDAYSPAVALAKARILGEIDACGRDLSKKTSLARRLRETAPGLELIECKACAGRRRKRDALPPFDIDCACKIDSLVEHRTDPGMGRERAKADLTAWILRGYAGVDGPGISLGNLFIHCHVDLQMREFDRDLLLDDELDGGQRTGQPAMRFAPVVAFDVAQHPAAGDFEAIGGLAVGLTDPEALLTTIAARAQTLRTDHCAALLERLAGRLPPQEAAALSGLLARPGAEVAELLAPHADRPEAIGLAYWAASRDHDLSGMAFTKLAQRLRMGPQIYEQSLAFAPLQLACSCPCCGADTHYAIHRLSVRDRLLTFSLACEACGHCEAYDRADNWTSAALTCGCASCRRRQDEVTDTRLPRVADALAAALAAAPRLASVPMRAAVTRITVNGRAAPTAPAAAAPAQDTCEWDARHVVLSQLEYHDRPDIHHDFDESIKVGGLRAGTVEEAVLAMASLGPSGVRYVDGSALVGGPRTLLDGAPPSWTTLLPARGGRGGRQAPLVKWGEALAACGLLHPQRSDFAPLTLTPRAWLECTFTPDRQREIASRNDLVVWRAVPAAEQALQAIGAAVKSATACPDYARQVAATIAAAAASHADRILDQARSIDVQAARAVVLQLERDGTVSVDALKAARDALKPDPQAAALLYAALRWRPGPGLGTKHYSVFAGSIQGAARERHPLTRTTACRRCGSTAATLTAAEQADWRVDCAACGHSDRSMDLYNPTYCDCQQCADAAAVALGGRSTAQLLAELAKHCTDAAEAMAAASAAEVVRGHGDLGCLVEKLGYNAERTRAVRQGASRASWKRLRFGSPLGLVRHVLPGYASHKPSLQALALLAEHEDAALPRPVYQALLSLMRVVRPVMTKRTCNSACPCVLMFRSTSHGAGSGQRRRVASPVDGTAAHHSPVRFIVGAGPAATRS